MVDTQLCIKVRHTSGSLFQNYFHDILRSNTYILEYIRWNKLVPWYVVSTRYLVPRSRVLFIPPGRYRPDSSPGCYTRLPRLLATRVNRTIFRGRDLGPQPFRADFLPIQCRPVKKKRHGLRHTSYKGGILYATKNGVVAKGLVEILRTVRRLHSYDTRCCQLGNSSGCAWEIPGIICTPYTSHGAVHCCCCCCCHSTTFVCTRYTRYFDYDLSMLHQYNVKEHY